MISPTMLAFSSNPIPGDAYSRASKERVVVSRDARKMIGLVVPAATVKLIIASNTSVGISIGIQMQK